MAVTKTQKNLKLDFLKVVFYLVILGYFWMFDVLTANGATLSLLPASGSFYLEQVFTLNVYVSSPDQAINAVSGLINFETDKLEVISLNKSGSIINYWIEEPSFSNSLGTIKFEGIVMNPGFIGNNGQVLGINFKAKGMGSSSLFFSSSSVLANDGMGTNILTNTLPASVNIFSYSSENKPSESESISINYRIPPALEIKSETHPDPTRWYNKTTAKFSWQLSSDITAVRLLLDKKPKSVPTISYSPPIETKTIEGIEEGIWYFHLQTKNQYGWGDISHYKIQIDKTPPTALSLRINNEGDPTNPQPELILEAEDKLSGIDYYEIKIGDSYSFKVEEQDLINGKYKVPPISPGKYSVIIRAFDKAGNYSLTAEEIKIEPIKAPIITDYPKQLYPGNPLIIKGEAFAKGTITVFIEDERKDIIFDSVKVDDNYKWSFVLGRTLDKGIYKIYAMLTDERGGKSSYSESVKVLVSPPIFIKIGTIVIDYLSVIISLISLIILLLITIFAGFYKIKRLRKKIRKETKEAEIVLYRIFNYLNKKIEEEINKFDNSSSLSRKEKTIIENLKKILKEGQEKIEKEIKDITKETNEES